MSDVDDLLTWLRAQLDDDAAKATAAGGSDAGGQWHTPDYGSVGMVWNANGDIVVYDEGSPTEAEAEHIARHDPARVLAEVDAKRRIIDAYQPGEHDDDIRFGNWRACSDECAFVVMDKVIKLLALPYADRPGYRDEWKP